MRVLTFSQTYPSHHPKKGHRIWFVEKIWKSLADMGCVEHETDSFVLLEAIYNQHYPCQMIPEERVHSHLPKNHTIRQGKKWKPGDWFKPVVWGTNSNEKSGKKGPYQSRQVPISPPIQVKKVFDIKIFVDCENGGLEVIIEGKKYCKIGDEKWDHLALNDGLSGVDLKDWLFKKSFKFIKGLPVFDGQIICWNENIEY